ncbi:MAG: fibronectin type III domain-containing protein [Niabella sp.]|nr:fibronectin type III domain-containing protein [Niabella sp.]
MKNRFLLLMVVALALASCESIFNDDYSAYSVKLVVPADSVLVADTVVQLSWNAIALPADYEVQLAQPRFDSLAQLIRDTVTKGTSYRVSGLEWGAQYQWRVRAIGSSSVSPYTKPRTFAVQK